MRALVLAFAIVLTAGCDSAPGAVRLHAPGVTGELVIDGETRGPVQAEQTIELTPGRHRIAIFDGTRERVASEVEVRSRMIADIAVDPGQLDALPPIVAAPPPELQRMLDEQIAAQRRALEEQAAMEQARAAAEAAALAAEAAHEEQAEPEARTSTVAAVSAALRGLRETCGDGVRAPARIDLEIHVRADGHVDRADASGDAPPALVACVRREARRWTIPVDDDDTSIRMPVVFSGASDL